MSIVNILLFLNVITFIIEMSIGNKFIDQFALHNLHDSKFRIYQLFTYSILHGSIFHLGFNMFALWMFGTIIEQRLGSERFIVLYLVSVLSAGIGQLIFSYFVNNNEPAIGASGGIFGILLAFGMYFPMEWLILIFPPIPIRAWLFVLLYTIFELVLGITGSEKGVAHFAHLGGAIGAFLLILFWGNLG